MGKPQAADVVSMVRLFKIHIGKVPCCYSLASAHSALMLEYFRVANTLSQARGRLALFPSRPGVSRLSNRLQSMECDLTALFRPLCQSHVLSRDVSLWEAHRKSFEVRFNEFLQRHMTALMEDCNMFQREQSNQSLMGGSDSTTVDHAKEAAETMHAIVGNVQFFVQGVPGIAVSREERFSSFEKAIDGMAKTREHLKAWQCPEKRHTKAKERALEELRLAGRLLYRDILDSAELWLHSAEEPHFSRLVELAQEFLKENKPRLEAVAERISAFVDAGTAMTRPHTQSSNVVEFASATRNPLLLPGRGGGAESSSSDAASDTVDDDKPLSQLSRAILRVMRAQECTSLTTAQPKATIVEGMKEERQKDKKYDSAPLEVRLKLLGLNVLIDGAADTTIREALRDLCNRGFAKMSGVGRGTMYYLLPRGIGEAETLANGQK